MIAIQLLERHGVKPTPNRVLIVRALEEAGRPLSLMELEERLETVDKSAVFRSLVTFREARLVHVLDGDPVRYELCHSHHGERDDDRHVHFSCIRCHRTFCLEDMPLPPVMAPEGYEVSEATYLLKGLCPACGGSPEKPA